MVRPHVQQDLGQQQHHRHLQRQFADERGTLGLVPQVLDDLLRDSGDDIDAGSDREADSPY